MSYAAMPFPPSTPIYPRAKVVEDYLDSFTSHFNLSPNIRLNTTVERLERDETNSSWRVRLSGSGIASEWLRFDKVVVANGHYRFPRFPNIRGLDEWLAAGKATHSAWYRRPVDSGSTILVIGRGHSGRDISAEMASLPSTSAVYFSVRETLLEPPRHSKVRYRGPVVEFRPIDGDGRGKVRYQDGTEDEIDSCILATGYKMTFPFLPDSLLETSLPPTPIPPVPKDKLYNSTYHIFPLFKHLFPVTENYPPTSLAFPGLPYRVSPLPLVEAQAHVMVKLWTSPGLLDVNSGVDAISSRYELLKNKFGGDEFQAARRFFLFGPLEEFHYRDELYTLAYGEDKATLKKYITPGWHKETFLQKTLLRTEWDELEKRGEADDLVKGVGKVSPDEWEELVYKLLQGASRKREIQDQ